jgi:hypothetical protein
MSQDQGEGAVVAVIAFFVFAGYLALKRSSLKRNAGSGRSGHTPEVMWRSVQLAHVDAMKGHEFEHYVARLLRNEGYRDVQVTQASGDFGVDITAWRGPQKFAVQVKRYSKNVDRSAVTDAVAGVKAYGCHKAMVVTNRFLTQAARRYAVSTECEIVDRGVLVQWIDRFRGDALPASNVERSHASGQALTLAPRTAAFAREDAGYQLGRLLGALIKVGRTLRTGLQAPTAAADDTPKLEIGKVDPPTPDENTLSSLSVGAGQVPRGVMTEIRQAQRAQFPNSLSTQLFAVEEEVRDYVELHSFRPPGVPEAVLKGIRQRAQASHPESYGSQLFDVKEDVSAWRTLQNFAPAGVPKELAEQILQTARSEHPEDFQTQLFVVEDEVAAYAALQQPPGSP